MTTVAQVMASLYPSGLPRNGPDVIVRTYTGGAAIASHPTVISRCDILHFRNAQGGLWDTVFIYYPTAKPRDQAIIAAIGHEQDNAINWTMEYASATGPLARGYIVAEMWMSGFLEWPPYERQIPNTYTPNSGSPFSLLSHDTYAQIDSTPGEPCSLHCHLDKVFRLVAYLKDTTRCTKVGIVGHSGGGWTALFAGAFDTRIDLVASVHGWCDRGMSGEPTRDYEQTHPLLTTGIAYHDFAAAIGSRPYLHITGSGDPLFGPSALGQPAIDAMISSVVSGGGTGCVGSVHTTSDHSPVDEEISYVCDRMDALGAPDYRGPTWTGTLSDGNALAAILNTLCGYPSATTAAIVGATSIRLAQQDVRRLWDAAQVSTLTAPQQAAVPALRAAITGST